MAYIVESTSDARTSPSLEFVDRDAANDLVADGGAGLLRLFTREQVPDLAHLESSHARLTEFVFINAVDAVSPEVMEVVEGLEPGLHQFFPVSIRRQRGSKPILGKDGAPLRDPYYVLNPGARLDAVWIEKSNVIFREFAPDKVIVSEKSAHRDKVVLRRSVVEGHHIWRGRWHLGNKLFFSDTLVQIAQERKWKGRNFRHVREE